MLLRRQFDAWVLAVPAYLLPGGLELESSAFGKGVRAHGRKRVKCGPKLGAGLGTAVGAPQPLAVAQPRPGEVSRHPGMTEQLDGLSVEVVDDSAVGQQGPRKRRRTTAAPIPLYHSRRTRRTFPWRLALGRSPIRLRCVYGQPRARNR
jgi:hypothetical protein